jgi:hypothetical protein
MRFIDEEQPLSHWQEQMYGLLQPQRDPTAPHDYAFAREPSHSRAVLIATNGPYLLLIISTSNQHARLVQTSTAVQKALACSCSYQHSLHKAEASTWRTTRK